MKFALIDGGKSTAEPRLCGICPHCGGEVVSRCGRVKVWHWAHKGNRSCDPWWESETEWHRNWKAHFPPEWQEVAHFDSTTGEKHVADVKNPCGLVIEFQHSAMPPAEMKSREAFYGQMVWVVDGLRGSLDKSYFFMGLCSDPVQRDPLAYSVGWWGRSRLLHNWSESNKKVFLDFGDEMLWRLVCFDPSLKCAIVGPLPKAVFIADCLAGDRISVTMLPESVSPPRP